MGGNDPQSPLAAFVTQTDASGTPTHRHTAQGKSGNDSPASGGGSQATAVTPGSEGESGGSGALCCCWQPSAKDKAGDGTQMVGGGTAGDSGAVGGAASPAAKKVNDL